MRKTGWTRAIGGKRRGQLSFPPLGCVIGVANCSSLTLNGGPVSHFKQKRDWVQVNKFYYLSVERTLVIHEGTGRGYEEGDNDSLGCGHEAWRVALLDFSSLSKLCGPSISFSFQMARASAATFALCRELTSASAWVFPQWNLILFFQLLLIFLSTPLLIDLGLFIIHRLPFPLSLSLSSQPFLVFFFLLCPIFIEVFLRSHWRFIKKTIFNEEFLPS